MGEDVITQRVPEERQARRLDRLARLPVFLDLHGRRAVVAGGTAAAAWKAELIAAAGAHVTIYAPDPGEELTFLLERGAADGTLTLARRPWDLAALRGAALAVADAGSEGEARAFVCAGRAAGVPVNLVEGAGDAAFGAIVNRSPVVVAVSTGGTAPVLGQAIRRRIETLIDPRLATWAARAARWRPLAATRIAGGAARRAFWDAYAEAAMRGREPPDTFEDALALPSAPFGRVTLVGAGPGDAGFMTLAGMRALQACDVILFDDLVSAEVLDLARREAKRIAVGKRGGTASCRQEDITQRMIDLARRGRTVVRLKAGDPMVFGRAGEEIAALEAAGIEVAIVPGITSAAALASTLGLSLTHREHAHALTFVTGRAADGSTPRELVAALGEGRTAIVYMGARSASGWVAAALGAGVDPALPAVAAASVSRPDLRLWRGPLADLPAGVAQLGEGPILIGAGRVFAQPAAASAAALRSAAAG